MPLTALLVALLAANTAYFVLFEARSKAIDAIAWLILLLLFIAETRFAHRLTSARGRFALRSARLLAGAGVLVAAFGYVFDDNRLDAVNSAVWIAVVVLLELQVRFRENIARANVAFSALAGLLYAVLAVLVTMWAIRGEWFDAYDALLWLVAFATIEVDLVSANKPANSPLPPR